MPGFFDALEKFKGKPHKKHFVDIDGQHIEVTLEQKLEIWREKHKTFQSALEVRYNIHALY